MREVVFILVLVFLTVFTLHSFFNLSNTINEIKYNNFLLSESLARQEEENKKLSNEISNLKSELTNTKAELKAEIEQLKERIKRERVVMPSFLELTKFLEEDRTDLLEYRKNEFNCVDFTNTFIKNFLKEGFFACETTLYIIDENGKEGAHSLVAVNTTNLGLIFIEPQNDRILYKIEVGDDYCDLVGWDCDYKITHIKHCFK